MKELFKYLGYVAVALAVFGAGWQLSDSYKGDIIQVRTEVETDTLFIVEKIPDVIEKIVFKDRFIHRIDTVNKTTILERTIKTVKTDTLYFAINPKYNINMENDPTIFNSVPEALPISRIFEMLGKKEVQEERELWEDLIVVALTSAATYGATKIK